MGDQPDARLLPTQYSRTQKNADTHTSGGIRTHDPSVREVEDRTALETARPIGPAKRGT
jgi:hypothetical protein